ncbi:sushi, nidogen and EGF-like domain-containing protein 1 [Folsomia candida]|uniref:sushi, nidogen and EGF-like domain-containing protein 1 n=1 Tax=Folsomia candida TaxID=158441 RepID=UPI001604A299|nr:sushi, nidogen and EGF-like domain-containing protein 1 [Folsomia candida]
MITGKEQKNPCTRNQCLNGGHCTPIDNFSSACICPSTFHGDLCQFRNFCAYSPCKNRGSCEPFEDSGVCSCLFGFEGTYCERKAEDVLLSEKNYDGGRDNADEDVKSAGLFTFMKTVKKSSWRDKVAFDPCYVPEGGGLIRCLNGGKCIPLVRRVGIVPGEGNQYECECTGKFTGPYCEFENACFSSPCKNGGSCQSFEDSGVCRCPVGFGGSFCEEIETGHKPSRIKKLTTEPVLKPPSKDDICYRYTKTRSHPCSHHGECISLNATHFECLCTEKYSGDSCQYRNPCYTFECLNGGTCEVKYDASGICNCAPGFMGTYCEEKLFKDEPEEIDVVTEKSSATRLCLNGGTFAHLKGSPSSSSSSYECICPSNFTGRWCEFLNACGSSPCLNGGSCEPMEDSGICTCPIGFKGTFCGEIDDTRKTRVERLGRTFPLVRKQIKEGIRISDDKEVTLKKSTTVTTLKPTARSPSASMGVVA